MNAAPETTQYFPKPGRTPPARLHVVPNPFQEEEHTTCVRPTGKATWKDILRMRGELPEPKPRVAKQKTPAVAVAPWNRKGFVYPEPTDMQGKRARVHASSQEDMQKIRATPKNLAALLKTGEWKGARVVGTIASPEIGQKERALAAATARMEEARKEIADLDQRIADATDQRVRETLEASRRSMWKARDERSKTVSDCQERLDHVRAEEWIHVIHPSGAELKIRPQWGE